MKQFKITVDQTDTHKLEDLMNKRNALQNLIHIDKNNPLVCNEELYQKFLSDYQQTLTRLDMQWDSLREKYGLDASCDLYIDFRTGVVTSVKDNT